MAPDVPARMVAAQLERVTDLACRAMADRDDWADVRGRDLVADLATLGLSSVDGLTAAQADAVVKALVGAAALAFWAGREEGRAP